MHLNTLPQISYVQKQNNTPSFKANFVFTKDSALALKKEMRQLAFQQPVKTLRGRNPLQILIKKIKVMHPNCNVKLFYEPKKHIGQSPINFRPVYSPARWVADSGNKRFVDAGFHMSESDPIPSETPITNLLKAIVKNPESFWGK